MANRRTVLKAAAASAAMMALPRVAFAVPGGVRANGFRTPGEEGPHERSLMQWPTAANAHGGADGLAAAQEAILRIANALAAFEPVLLLAPGDLHGAIAPRLTGKVELWNIATATCHARDSAPVFVTNPDGQLAAMRFASPAAGPDAEVAAAVAQRLGLHLFEAGLTGFGGGIETDGSGVAFAHESDWVGVTGNPSARADVEAMLLEATGSQLLVWAPGVAGMQAGSVARFVAPRTMVAQLPEEPYGDQPLAVAAFGTYRVLENWADADKNGVAMSIVPAPYEPRVKDKDFLASYAGFYACNGGLLLPQFGDKDTDAEVVRTLSAMFPGREAVALDIDALARTGAGIRRSIREQPASKGVWKP